MKTPKREQGIASIAGKLYGLLEPLESEERMKAVAASLIMLGENPVEAGLAQRGMPGHRAVSSASGTATVDSAKQFFDAKDPQTKIEEFAVAARHREMSSGAETHERGELESVIKSARRNFDSKHYRRDIANAKTAGLFNKGSGNTLAYYGQEYVDALPDREAVKSIRRPKAAGRRSRRKARTLSRKPER